MMKARDKGGGCLFWILSAASLIFLLLAIREYAPFLANDIKMQQLQKEVAPEEGTESEDADTADTEIRKKVPKWASREIDWKKLQKINPDIIAWIRVPGTKIDYPILHCHKWNDYLHKDYKGDYSKPGSVFIQPETPEDLSDFHLIIYGHNMRNKSMFGSLHKYEEESFWEKHRKVYIYQPGKAIRFKVFAASDCRDGSETYRMEYKDDQAREEWIRMIRADSYFATKDKVAASDIILTLSTCSNGGPRSSRYTVHSVQKEVISLVE